MKKLLIFVLLSLTTLSLQARDTEKPHHHKRVVVVKPARPHHYTHRPQHVRAGYVWVEGHWRWHKRSRTYVWVEGHLVKRKKGHHWVAGHWKKVPGGWVYIEGRWVR
ncbi:MAG TPA: hypothetical protein ENJ39_06105 [Flammeovirgaceae bacterium]|nr:hypothetical protein [Flammeovirgaceae bacterium]